MQANEPTADLFAQDEWKRLSGGLTTEPFASAVRSLVRFSSGSRVSLSRVASRLRDEGVRFFLFPAVDSIDPQKLRLWCSTKPFLEPSKEGELPWSEHRNLSWKEDERHLLPGSLDWQNCQLALDRVTLEITPEVAIDHPRWLLDTLRAVAKSPHKTVQIMDEKKFESVRRLLTGNEILGKLAASTGVRFVLQDTNLFLAPAAQEEGGKKTWNLFYSRSRS